MTSVDVAIGRLTDRQATELVDRLIRANRVSPVAGPPDPEVAASVASALSLPDEATVTMSAGDIARAILLLLASDHRHRDGIAALVNSPVSSSFGPGDGAVEPLAALEVLQGQFDVFSPTVESSSGSRLGGNGRGDLARSLAQQLLAYAGLRRTGPQADATYKVWYATSRRPVAANDPTMGYGTDRDDHVHYGTCSVFVPTSHKIGSIGSPWWKRAVTVTDDRLRLLAIEPMHAETFWQAAAAQLAQVAEDDRDAVVFVHGFNVDFQAAALRAAQIGFDMQVKGAMAFYSWASRGQFGKYLADEAAVELDEEEIADYLCTFARITGARRVHVIAHSMGNRAVLRAVDRIARDAQLRSGVRFGQFVLAAPDVDVRKFQQLCAAYKVLSDQTTLYVSSRDLAVEASHWLHDFPRVGLLPPVTVAEGIDTVNVVNADLTLLGHGYVAEARGVMSDMHALVRHGSPPRNRFGIRSMSTEHGQPYWLIGA